MNSTGVTEGGHLKIVMLPSNYSQDLFYNCSMLVGEGVKGGVEEMSRKSEVSLETTSFYQ